MFLLASAPTLNPLQSAVWSNAFYAAQCLQELGEFRGEARTRVQVMIEHLLTPNHCALLRPPHPPVVLPFMQALVLQRQTPLLLWSQDNIADLRVYVDKCIEGLKTNTCMWDGLEEALMVFEHSAHHRELRCGGVFVRVYIENPKFPLPDPRGFVEEISRVVADGAERVSPASSGVELGRMTSLVRALLHALEGSPGAEKALTAQVSISISSLFNFNVQYQYFLKYVVCFRFCFIGLFVCLNVY
jgi:hypothetical protein